MNLYQKNVNYSAGYRLRNFKLKSIFKSTSKIKVCSNPTCLVYQIASECELL